MIIVNHDSTFESWRNIARRLLEDKIHFDDVIWQAVGTGSLFDNLSTDPGKKSSALSIPRSFLQDAEFVACNRDNSTWPLLYRLAYRLIYEEKNLLSISLDNDVLEFHRRMKLVSRDVHKMRAFVRFREITHNDESIYMAWHRPDYRILKFSAPFFTDRFNGMNWIIHTEEESMSWIHGKLSFGPGRTQREAQATDITEDLWKDYYGSIFNPGRVKVRAMKKELPVRHWASLPEAQIIDQLLVEAPKRLEEFYESQRPSAIACIPKEATLPELKAALPKCRACGICEKATQAVFGEGPSDAQIVFIGEQPGNEEDLQNSPFIGPAGSVLMDAFKSANIKREDVYLTNAVKGFKWTDYQGMRKHKNPLASEIAACRPWIKTELEIIKPKIVVCLGASAAQSVFGKMMKVADSRGKVFKTSACDLTFILPHPSSILRTEDTFLQEKLYNEFTSDLIAIAHIYREISTSNARTLDHSR